MTNRSQAIPPKETGSSVADLWFIPRRPDTKRGWPVYSLDFILLALQGRVTEPHRINRKWYWVIPALILQMLMNLAQALIMLLAWLPGTSCLVETIARVFTRNAAGFFLRACYWKTKLRYLGQDTFIDQNVEIWGASDVSVGSHCHIDTNVRLAAGERRHAQHGWISIGDGVHIGPGVHIAGRGGVKIGSFVGIMANVHLYSATGVIEYPADPGKLIAMSHMAPHDQQHVAEGPIWIEDYAVIGMMTRILPGVRVGRGAIVHANCELHRHVPAFANVGAIPTGRQIGWRKPRRKSPHLADETRTFIEEPSPVVPDATGDWTRIREVTDPDNRDAVSQVVDLHFSAFPDGVTSQLGRTFVTQYYRAMIRSEEASLWIAERAGTVEGFLGCVLNRHAFERAHRSGAARLLAWWRFMTLRLTPLSILRALRKQHLSKHAHDQAELLSIVVAPELRRTGLGKRFLNIWSAKLKERNLSSYIVFTDNPEGIGFYEKYGGERLFKFKLGTVWSACYRFDFKDNTMTGEHPVN